MHDSKKYNYFFSYSRDIYDEIASLLIKNIEEYSLRLWVDKTDVLLGSNINLSIHKVLEDVKTWNGAIVLLDKSYFRKTWCLMELDYFLNNDIKIYPILYGMSRFDIPQKYRVINEMNIARITSPIDLHNVTNRIIDTFLSSINIEKSVELKSSSSILQALIDDWLYDQRINSITLIKIENIILLLRLLLKRQNYTLKLDEIILYRIISKKKEQMILSDGLLERYDFLIAQKTLMIILKKFNILPDIVDDFKN